MEKLADKVVALNAGVYPALASDARKSARELDASDNIDVNLVQLHLLESYERCRACDVDAKLQAFLQQDGEIQVFTQRPESLARRAQDIFADTFRYLPNQQDILILADRDRRVSELLAAPELVFGLAAKIRLKVGVSLDENSCGTNVVDLALRHNAEFILPGNLHYCEIFQPWCWAAVPVIDGQGVAVGCVAIATDYQPYWLRRERLALARLMARELGCVLLNWSDGPESEAVPKISLPSSTTVTLSLRQRQVLVLFAQGLSYKQIARELGINSTKTVEEYLDAVRVKFKASSRRACIQCAMKSGLL